MRSDLPEGRFSLVSWIMLAVKHNRRPPTLAELGASSDPYIKPWRYDAPSRGPVEETQLQPPRPPHELDSPPPEPREYKTKAFSDDDRDRPINILCMDGGGIRGRCLLAMVEEMEQLLGGPVSAHFDLIAGTSIGGCGSIFLSRYPEPGQATRMGRLALTELQKRCFANQNWRRLLRDGFLCRDARREFMLELCGPTQPLRSAPGGPRAFAVAARRCGQHATLEPFLFRTYDLPKDAARRGKLQGTGSVPLWQAVEATSAAPILFPRACLDVFYDVDEDDTAAAGSSSSSSGGSSSSSDGVESVSTDSMERDSSGRKKATVWLADGGLVANDPTAIALREARALWPDRPIGTVLSLGTGAASPLGADGGDEPARSDLGKAVRSCGGPSARYYRLNPPIKGVSMIESNEEKLRGMEDITRKYFRENLDAREACTRLVEARARRRSASWRRNWPLTARCVQTVRLAHSYLLAWMFAWLRAILARLAVLIPGHGRVRYWGLDQIYSPQKHRRSVAYRKPAATVPGRLSYAMP